MDKRDQFGLDEGGQFELDERGQDGLDFPFKKLGDLIMHLQKIEKSTYMLKEFLHMDEAAQYLGITKGCLYKMTASNRITCYKPGGKQIFIHRDDLNNWIKSNRIISDEEMRRKQLEYEIFKGELSEQKRKKGANK